MKINLGKKESVFDPEVEARIKNSFERIGEALKDNRCYMLPEFIFNSLSGPNILVRVVPAELVDAAQSILQKEEEETPPGGNSVH